MTSRNTEGTPGLQAGEGWRRSSRSGNNGNGGNCVEARFTGAGFEVRDSKLGNESPRISLSANAFDDLLSGIKTGEIA
ncbi:DUF397 domain-containing protein [Glycomyces xiaoerkulensis]|uniref:DUF397 domain-containing protein n=1 Tax=Glycomyces xiaoerkulensis TaxID=2038139 RepID=UPI000C261B30|nr:DUF397 domain-containing protein [Glycomyces xiaoerkulensis]